MDVVFLVETAQRLLGLFFAFSSLTLIWMLLSGDYLSLPTPSRVLSPFVDPLFRRYQTLIAMGFAIGVLQLTHFWDFTIRHVHDYGYWWVLSWRLYCRSEWIPPPPFPTRALTPQALSSAEGDRLEISRRPALWRRPTPLPVAPRGRRGTAPAPATRRGRASSGKPLRAIPRQRLRTPRGHALSRPLSAQSGSPTNCGAGARENPGRGWRCAGGDVQAVRGQGVSETRLHAHAFM